MKEESRKERTSRLLTDRDGHRSDGKRRWNWPLRWAREKSGVERPDVTRAAREKSTIERPDARVASERSTVERPDVIRTGTYSVQPFHPAPGLGGSFRQTVLGALLPARYPRSLPPCVKQEIAVEGPDIVSVLITPARAATDASSPTSDGPTRPEGRKAGRIRGRLVLLHGLGGSASSRYMLRTLVEAHHRGWEVARVNFRGADAENPGGATLHNAGRSDDVASILDQARWSREAQGTPVMLVGFSLGGAVLLRYLGERGSDTSVVAAAAVAPPVDLSICLEQLERRRNRLYHRYYVERMKKQILRKIAAHPGVLPAMDRRIDSVRSLDEVFTAPDAGYVSAAAYYAGASALPLLESVTVPVLILSSRDDPFVLPAAFEDLARRNSAFEVALTSRGGHVGYLARSGGRLRFWAVGAILDWLERRVD